MEKERCCSIDGCVRSFSSSHKGIDYCNKHYQSDYRYGTPYENPRVGNEYEVIEDYVKFYTSKGETYLIDLEDIHLVKDFKWTKNRAGYLVRNMNQKTILRLHRVVLGITDKDKVLDHNGVRS